MHLCRTHLWMMMMWIWFILIWFMIFGWCGWSENHQDSIWDDRLWQKMILWSEHFKSLFYCLSFLKKKNNRCLECEFVFSLSLLLSLFLSLSLILAFFCDRFSKRLESWSYYHKVSSAFLSAVWRGLPPLCPSKPGVLYILSCVERWRSASHLSCLWGTYLSTISKKYEPCLSPSGVTHFDHP